MPDALHQLCNGAYCEETPPRPCGPPLSRALAALVEGGSRCKCPMLFTSFAVALTVKRLLPGPPGHPSSGHSLHSLKEGVADAETAK